MHRAWHTWYCSFSLHLVGSSYLISHFHTTCITPHPFATHRLTITMPCADYVDPRRMGSPQCTRLTLLPCFPLRSLGRSHWHVACLSHDDDRRVIFPPQPLPTPHSIPFVYDPDTHQPIFIPSAPSPISCRPRPASIRPSYRIPSLSSHTTSIFHITYHTIQSNRFPSKPIHPPSKPHPNPVSS